MSAKIKGMAKTVLNDANVSVAIVEDNADTRKSWAKLLEAHPRIKCIATCESAEAALKRIPDLCPQVVLMDINLPGMSGIQCAALLKQKLPAVQILMLTAYSDNDYIFEALQAGASGYLLKSTSSPELINSILEVVTGGAPMTGQIARRVIEVFRKSNSKGKTDCPRKRNSATARQRLCEQGNRFAPGMRFRHGENSSPAHL